MRKVDELKKKYPDLWEKARARFRHQVAQERYFKALVESKIARRLEKEISNKEKKTERKRRTRALILFAIAILKNYHDREKFLRLVESVRQNLVAKEGNKLVDYTNYLIAEFERNQSREEEERRQRGAVFVK